MFGRAFFAGAYFGDTYWLRGLFIPVPNADMSQFGAAVVIDVGFGDDRYIELQPPV